MCNTKRVDVTNAETCNELLILKERLPAEVAVFPMVKEIQPVLEFLITHDGCVEGLRERIMVTGKQASRGQCRCVGKNAPDDCTELAIVVFVCDNALQPLDPLARQLEDARSSLMVQSKNPISFSNMIIET